MPDATVQLQEARAVSAQLRVEVSRLQAKLAVTQRAEAGSRPLQPDDRRQLDLSLAARVETLELQLQASQEELQATRKELVRWREKGGLLQGLDELSVGMTRITPEIAEETSSLAAKDTAAHTLWQHALEEVAMLKGQLEMAEAEREAMRALLDGASESLMPLQERSQTAPAALGGQGDYELKSELEDVQRCLAGALEASAALQESHSCEMRREQAWWAVVLAARCRSTRAMATWSTSTALRKGLPHLMNRVTAAEVNTEVLPEMHRKLQKATDQKASAEDSLRRAEEMGSVRDQELEVWRARAGLQSRMKEMQEATPWTTVSRGP